MNIFLQTAGPAEDLTLLVTTPIPPADRPALSRRLRAIPQLLPRRVWFLTPPVQGGVVRLAGPGEPFSANAAALAALSFAVSRGVRREKKLPVELDGLDAPCPVHVNPLAGQATVTLPLPLSVTRTTLLEQETPLVVFPGIVHALWRGAPPEEDALRQGLADLCQTQQVPAAGAMGWDFRAGTMTPTVYLTREEALVSRATCASGAAAAAAWTALHNRETHRKLTLRQPGGTLQASALCQGGRLHRLTVTLDVALGLSYDLALPDL